MLPCVLLRSLPVKVVIRRTTHPITCLLLTCLLPHPYLVSPPLFHPFVLDSLAFLTYSLRLCSKAPFPLPALCYSASVLCILYALASYCSLFLHVLTLLVTILHLLHVLLLPRPSFLFLSHLHFIHSYSPSFSMPSILLLSILDLFPVFIHASPSSVHCLLFLSVISILSLPHHHTTQPFPQPIILPCAVSNSTSHPCPFPATPVLCIARPRPLPATTSILPPASCPLISLSSSPRLGPV